MTGHDIAKAATGFTLIELLTVVSVLAILVAIAVPNMRPLIDHSRVRDAAAELQGGLYFARSEALRQGSDVQVTAKGGDWGAGWEVRDSGGHLLQQRVPAANTAITLDTPGADGVVTIYFDRWGTASTAANAAAGSATRLDFLLKPNAASDDSGIAAIRLCLAAGGSATREPQGAACPT